jgi:hypothetical protein
MASSHPCHSSALSPDTHLHLPRHHASHPTETKGASGGSRLPNSHLYLLIRTQVTGVVGGFIFESLRPRPTRVSFTSIVPQGEGFENPRYIQVEAQFSKKVKRGLIHESVVVVGRSSFLVSAYWDEEVRSNLAVATLCPGLEWKGEIAVVQAGRFVTFYKEVKSLSTASKAVSRSVVEFSCSQILPTSFVKVHLRIQV